MNAHSPPDAARVKDILGMVFDGLSVKPGAKLDTSPKGSSYFGVYVLDQGTPAALCGCDIAFAAHTGSALSMLPAGTAREAIKAKSLTPVMLANLHEVMNICTRLILRDESPHLRLRQVAAATALPPDAAALLSSAKRRVDLEVDVAKYGPGLLCVLCGG